MLFLLAKVCLEQSVQAAVGISVEQSLWGWGKDLHWVSSPLWWAQSP